MDTEIYTIVTKVTKMKRVMITIRLTSNGRSHGLTTR